MSSIPRPFDRVQFVGDCGPVFPSDLSEYEAADRWISAVKACGASEVQVNWMLDLVHPMVMENPTHSYLRFFRFAPSLDQYVSSRWSVGLYPESHLARNRERLKLLAAAAVRHGLKPVLFCAEPRAVPERLFERQPTWRGPRVDNPTLGCHPYYALCTDIPEVRAHYREMLARLLQEIPDITCISLFSQDCGTGFCYADDLYAGPNGPRACRGTATGQRVAAFCDELLAAGRAVNPHFDVILTSQFDAPERTEILAAARAEVNLAVWGRYSWQGGLEDWYAYQQFRRRLPAVGHEQARAERVADFRERIAEVAASGREPVAVFSGPTAEYHYPCLYVPSPWHNLRILETLGDLGVRHLQLRGLSLDPRIMPYDVNREAQQRYLAGNRATAETIVAEIAEEWAGDAAETLLDAWRLCETAVCNEALWNQSLGRELRILPGPLVPDHSRLSAAEWAPFDHECFAERDAACGPGAWCDFLEDEQECIFVLRHYQTETLPKLQEACDLLRQAAIERAQGTAGTALELTRKLLLVALCWRTTKYHWLEMVRLRRGRAPRPEGLPSATAIVNAEIANARALVEVIRKEPGKLFGIGVTDGNLYSHGPSFLRRTQLREQVMTAHRNDPLPECGNDAPL